MKSPFARLLVLLLCLSCRLTATAQDRHICTLEEKIQIEKDTSFTVQTTVCLQTGNAEVRYPVFYDQELEHISAINVYLKKGKRFKLLKKPEIADEQLQIDDISSKRIRAVLIPPQTFAKIEYTVACNELMYLSSLRFFSYDDIDTMRYELTVPDEFHFSGDKVYTDSLKYLSVDSLKTVGSTTWRIEAVPVKVEPDLLMIFGIYKNIKAPLMRTIVVPASYQNREREYLNNWYLDNVEAQRGLDSLTRLRIDELTKQLTDPVELMDTLYSFVKMNFKYFGICFSNIYSVLL